MNRVIQDVFEVVTRRLPEANVEFLMIGGHAVTALGHPRATYDLDLLIPRSSASKWRELLMALNYRSFAENSNFHQYEAGGDLPLPPVDLMLVDDDVYGALEETKTDTPPIPTPGVVAMVALKLHAIKQPGRGDAHQDWSDILALVKAHGLTLDDAEFSATVLKHGGEKAIQRIKAAITGGT